LRDSRPCSAPPIRSGENPGSTNVDPRTPRRTDAPGARCPLKRCEPATPRAGQTWTQRLVVSNRPMVIPDHRTRTVGRSDRVWSPVRRRCRPVPTVASVRSTLTPVTIRRGCSGSRSIRPTRSEADCRPLVGTGAYPRLPRYQRPAETRVRRLSRRPRAPFHWSPIPPEWCGRATPTLLPASRADQEH
jgi:hypothetical protein